MHQTAPSEQFEVVFFAALGSPGSSHTEPISILSSVILLLSDPTPPLEGELSEVPARQLKFSFFEILLMKMLQNQLASTDWALFDTYASRDFHRNEMYSLVLITRSPLLLQGTLVTLLFDTRSRKG